MSTPQGSFLFQQAGPQGLPLKEVKINIKKTRDLVSGL